MKHETISSCAVVILPTKDVGQAAINMSESLSADFETNFTLGISENRPHISIYQFAYPHRNLNEITQAVKDVARELRGRINITLKGYNLSYLERLDWKVARTKVLSALHRKIVGAINPLREGLVTDACSQYMAGYGPMTPNKRISIGLWGDPFAMDTFYPHMDLTSFVHHPEAGAGPKALPNKEHRFVAEGLFITSVGKHDTCPIGHISAPFENQVIAH